VCWDWDFQWNWNGSAMCGFSLSAKGDGMGPELIAVLMREMMINLGIWGYLGDFGGTHVRIVYIYSVF